MMINKRLIGLCEESKKFIGLTVLMNWIALLCNIMIILFVGDFINSILHRAPVKGVSIFYLIVLLAVRFISNILYGKFSALASEHTKTKLRESVYKKLLKLGIGYGQVGSTASLVQVMVEGVEQLEIYFGRYLPQLIYALLAPITLFVVVMTISWKAAAVLLICVPLIPRWDFLRKLTRSYNT